MQVHLFARFSLQRLMAVLGQGIGLLFLANVFCEFLAYLASMVTSTNKSVLFIHQRCDSKQTLRSCVSLIFVEIYANASSGLCQYFWGRMCQEASMPTEINGVTMLDSSQTLVTTVTTMKSPSLAHRLEIAHLICPMP